MNHLIQKEKIWKKLLQCCSGPPSWASGSWRPSCRSCKSWRGQIHPKILISHQVRAHFRNPKLKYKIFLFFINNFSQNAYWNLKPLNQPARQIWTPLHCECNISVTMKGIIKWLGYTIHRLHSYNWFKFEDLTPTGSDSREHQKVSIIKWHDLYLGHVSVGEGDGGEGEGVLQHDHDEVVVAPLLVRDGAHVVHATVVAVLHHDHLRQEKESALFIWDTVFILK